MTVQAADSTTCVHEDAVKWNAYNKVVQCHRCGQVFTPGTAASPIDVEELREVLRQRRVALSVLHQIYKLGIDPKGAHLSARAITLLNDSEPTRLNVAAETTQGTPVEPSKSLYLWNTDAKE